MARYSRKELMARVQISIRELHLASMTQANRKRLHYVEQGLYALDEEQALLKSGIEELLEQFAKNRKVLGSFVADAAETLVQGLQKLVSDELPRVNYPDMNLLEETRREIPLRGPAPSKSTVKQLKNVQENPGKIPRTRARVK